MRFLILTFLTLPLVGGPLAALFGLLSGDVPVLLGGVVVSLVSWSILFRMMERS